MKKITIALAFFALLAGCDRGSGDSHRSPGRPPGPEKLGEMELWKLEIMLQDRTSSSVIRQGGPSSWSEAFAPDGTMVRSGLGEIRGQEAIHEAFMADVYSNALVDLTWIPERAEVSQTGDLGYTVGQYLAVVADTTGARSEVRGTYVRLWRRQADDSWKVELDIRNPVTKTEQGGPMALGSQSGNGGT